MQPTPNVEKFGV